jgi:hypothetical protein
MIYGLTWPEWIEQRGGKSTDPCGLRGDVDGKPFRFRLLFRRVGVCLFC